MGYFCHAFDNDENNHKMKDGSYLSIHEGDLDCTLIGERLLDVQIFTGCDLEIRLRDRVRWLHEHQNWSN